MKSNGYVVPAVLCARAHACSCYASQYKGNPALCGACKHRLDGCGVCGQVPYTRKLWLGFENMVAGGHAYVYGADGIPVPRGAVAAVYACRALVLIALYGVWLAAFIGIIYNACKLGGAR